MAYLAAGVCNGFNSQSCPLPTTNVYGESANSCIHYCPWKWMNVLSQLQALIKLSPVEETLIPVEKKAGWISHLGRALAHWLLLLLLLLLLNTATIAEDIAHWLRNKYYLTIQLFTVFFLISVTTVYTPGTLLCAVNAYLREKSRSVSYDYTEARCLMTNSISAL
jgi:hypothetical protein